FKFDGSSLGIRTYKKSIRSFHVTPQTDLWRFRLDGTTTTRLIDLVNWFKDFDNDTIYSGIYTIDGDTLKVCLSMEPGNRPTTFQSKTGTKTILVTLKKRAAKKKD